MCSSKEDSYYDVDDMDQSGYWTAFMFTSGICTGIIMIVSSLLTRVLAMVFR
jgi:hypothetical protein